MVVTARKWGNSLGVRVPKALAEEVGLADGARVDIRAEGGTLVIAPSRPRYSLADVLANVTPEVAGAYDWGPDVGREIIDDELRT